MQALTLHQFHIPVMGLAFTIDTPIKVARFGITSAISIVEDNLIEAMRKHYYQQIQEPYIAITTQEEDYRARRITDYLNLVNRIVSRQMDKLRRSAFEAGSEVTKYFQMLPDSSILKKTYTSMLALTNDQEREQVQQSLRNALKPGAIEVNIMTKLDKNSVDKEGFPVEDGSDAVAALRGYAKSELNDSAIIFSAGMNPRLFNYLEKLDQFDPLGWGQFQKRIIIKVSDYRSALIQGKYLAKKGIWVSEFRIESGLNCGGHAFATEGLLMGPILEEFKNKREELTGSLFELYNQARKANGKMVYDKPHPIRITIQGGIGTAAEDNFLHSYYHADSTGWGTPFLLCPEATTVDAETLKLLSKAGEKDVILSKKSPLGVRFNYLKGTSADRERVRRIERGTPGSPCTEKFLEANTEFTTEPICTASRKYQRLKLEQLLDAGLSPVEYERQVKEVLDKECLCIGLSNAAAHEYNVTFVKNLTSVTICPGPNIAYFNRVVSLQEMTDHIYGRSNVLETNDRPHMFIKELTLYIKYITEKISEDIPMEAKAVKYNINFCENLLSGIDYYRTLQKLMDVEVSFAEALHIAELKVQNLLTLIHTLSSANQEA